VPRRRDHAVHRGAEAGRLGGEGRELLLGAAEGLGGDGALEDALRPQRRAV
jgi:hypothetical protein